MDPNEAIGWLYERLGANCAYVKAIENNPGALTDGSRRAAFELSDSLISLGHRLDRAASASDENKPTPQTEEQSQ